MPARTRFAFDRRNFAVILILVCAALVVFAACGEADEDLTPTATSSSGADSDTEEPTPTSDGDSTEPTEAPEDEGAIAFPRQDPAVGWNDAALPGVLVEQDGCLWVESDDGTLTLPIWWNEQEYRIEDGTVQLLDENGEVAAEVGDRVTLGGSGMSDWEDADTLPEACQSGPFWNASPEIRNEDERAENAVQPPKEYFTYDRESQPVDESEVIAAVVAFNDGCLTIQPSTSDQRYTAVWPAGTEFESNFEELDILMDGTQHGMTNAMQGQVVSGIEAGDLDDVHNLVQLENEATACDGPFWIVDSYGSEPGLQDEKDAIRQDAAFYAVDQGISLDEAIERLEAQSSGSDQIADLNNELRSSESDTFGGLWLQHEPDYGIVVAFTENGEETLAPYIEDLDQRDLIEVIEVEYSQQELEDAQEEAIRLLRDADLDINFASGIPLMENSAEVYVPDKEQFEAELERLGITLPEAITIVEENMSGNEDGG